MRPALRIGAILCALFLCLGIPGLYYAHAGTLFREEADAVSGATQVVPDQPSGAFLVFLNTTEHRDTVQAWRAFFSEEPVGVIMEDLHCLTIRQDAPGCELARRYQARLAENQMKVVPEDGTLVLSRMEQGMFDVAVLSEEAAGAYNTSLVEGMPQVEVIEISGEGTCEK